MAVTDGRANRQIYRRVPGGAAPVRESEEGFALIAVVVAIFLILLAMSVAAPRVARALRRDREVETMRRADQYVRAIRLYYKKFGHYPGSMEQLEKSNNIRFLRERWVDPMTGTDDWRLIHVGEQKTTVKGFFGKPLAGIASSGLGSAAGNASAGGNGTPVGAGGLGGSAGSGIGGGGGSGFTLGGGGSASPSSDPTAATGADGSTGAAVGANGGAGGLGPGNGASGSTSGFGSNTAAGGLGSASGSGLSGGAPFLGVGVPREGASILTVNEQTTYPTWEFLYDPRIEQLRSRSNLLGGGIASTGAGSLGSASGLSSGTPGSSFGGQTPGAATPSGSSGGSGTVQPASPPQQ